MKKVSVIIPVYNGEKYIERCLNSIEHQTYENVELIIVNDGSKDGTLKTIREWIDDDASRKERVILIDQDNSGAAMARNAGIEVATGDYLMFADQDDYALESYCEEFVKRIELQKADIVVGGYSRYTPEGVLKFSRPLQAKNWAEFTQVAPWAHIYDREFIKRENIRFLKTGIGEDIYFNLRAYAAAEKIGYIENAAYVWVWNEDSVSNSRQNTIKPEVNPKELLDYIYTDIKNNAFLASDRVEYFMVRYVCWYMLFSCSGSKREDIRKMHRSLNEWLRIHYPNYKKNRYIGLRKPEGELSKIHGVVVVYYLLEKMGIMERLLELRGVK